MSGFNFGTSQPSLFGTGGTSTSTGFGFGGTTSTAPTGFGFGSTGTTTTASTGFGFGTGTTTSAPGFGFGTTGTASTGFGFGTTPASTASTGFGFGFGNQPKTTASTGFGFGFGTTTTASTGFGFGTTTTASTGFGFGTTTTASTGFGFPSAATNTGIGSFGFGGNTGLGATHCNLTIKPKTVSVGIQCNRYLDVTNPLPTVTPCKPIPNFEEELIEEEDCFRDDPINDTDYEPDSEDYSSDENEVDETEHQVTDRKFIVSQTELLQLFKSCPVCASPSLASVKQVVGTMCKVQQTCSACNHSRVWHSQPSLGAIPEGNLLMSAAILFSGSIPSKAIRFMQHMNVAAISSRTFHNHQKAYIQPAITKTWCQFQNKYIADMIEKQQPLSLGGDGRADTPGHSAKYGSYGMLDLNLMLVVDLQLVQSNEVKSSFHMEKEGFMRSVNFLQGKGLTIGEIVTDRHVQLVKYIREEMTNTTHHFDVWHVAKGQQQIQQQDPSREYLANMAQAISMPQIFGDERDTVIARWNQVQALWGFGKGYLGPNRSVEFKPDNPFCRFKAVGYSCMPLGKNEDGLVTLYINQPVDKVKSCQQQALDTINKALGNLPQMTVCAEAVLPHPDNMTELVIYVMERPQMGAAKRIPSLDVYRALTDPKVKPTLTSMLNIKDITHKVMTKDQLKQYLDNPPAGLNPLLWQQGILDNPDPEKLIPVPMMGFKELHRRLKIQEHHTKLHQQRLDLISGDLTDFQNKQGNMLAKLEEYKRKHLELSHRVLQVIVKQEIYRKQGFGIQADEEQLRVQLETLQAELNHPTQFKGRLNELMSQIRMQNHLASSRAEVNYQMDPSMQQEIKHLLKQQQEGLQHLIEITKEDMQDLNVIEQGLTDNAATRR